MNIRMKRLRWSGALAPALLLACEAAATPPPPSPEVQLLNLPPDQCAVLLEGAVRAYSQPVHIFEVAATTVLRLLASGADPALLVDLEHADDDRDARPVATGVGLAGGDVRIALPAAGRYRLRVLMTGDAARSGRAIPYRLSVGRATESGAPPCRTGAAR